ncbi:transcription elongation factor spt5, partial [Marasmius sp. AFHP31]
MSTSAERASKRARRLIDDITDVSSDEDDEQSTIDEEPDDDGEEGENLSLNALDMFAENAIRPTARSGHLNFQAVLDRHEAMALTRETRTSENAQRPTRREPTPPSGGNITLESNIRVEENAWPIFRFRCKPGKEMGVVLELMQRCIKDSEYANLIRSAFWNGRPGSVYLETQGLSVHLTAVLKGFDGFIRSRGGQLEATVLDHEEIIPALTTTSLHWQNCTSGEWVKITSGPYKGDVGLILERHVPLRHLDGPMRGRSSTKRQARVVVLVVPRLKRPTVDDPDAKPNTLKRPRKHPGRPPRERMRWWKDIDSMPGFVETDWGWICEEGICTSIAKCSHLLYAYRNQIIDCDLSRTIEAVGDLSPLGDYVLHPEDPLFLSDHPFVKTNLYKLPTPNNWQLNVGDLVYMLCRTPAEPDILHPHQTVSVVADPTYPQGVITEIKGTQCIVTTDLVVEGEEIRIDSGRKIRVRVADGKELAERLWSREVSIWDVRKSFQQGDEVIVCGGEYEGVEGLVINAVHSATTEETLIHVVRTSQEAVIGVHVNSLALSKASKSQYLPTSQSVAASSLVPDATAAHLGKPPATPSDTPTDLLPEAQRRRLRQPWIGERVVIRRGVNRNETGVIREVNVTVGSKSGLSLALELDMQRFSGTRSSNIQVDYDDVRHNG